MEFASNLTGTMAAISHDGRSAVVRLDEPCDGKSFAVISPQTKGRVPFMNKSKTGTLEHGTRVRLTALKDGPEAFLATEIKEL
jgi:hypothetical protein